VYLRYCGACHGSNGAGDDIAGTFMAPKPTVPSTFQARPSYGPSAKRTVGRSGAQALGEDGPAVDKRISTLAVAIASWRTSSRRSTRRKTATSTPCIRRSSPSAFSRIPGQPNKRYVQDLMRARAAEQSVPEALSISASTGTPGEVCSFFRNMDGLIIRAEAFMEMLESRA
jgi:hypothetical protein